LEGNNALPQNERHTVRQRISRSQKTDSTLLYIQLEKTLFDETTDEFTAKVARNPEDVKALLEVGIEYICQKDDLMFFRKRK
jgi:hypothetical protein